MLSFSDERIILYADLKPVQYLRTFIELFQEYYSKALKKADVKKQKVLLRIIKRLVGGSSIIYIDKTQSDIMSLLMDARKFLMFD